MHQAIREELIDKTPCQVEGSAKRTGPRDDDDEVMTPKQFATYKRRMLQRTSALPDFSGTIRRHLHRQAQQLRAAILDADVDSRCGSCASAPAVTRRCSPWARPCPRNGCSAGRRSDR